MVCAWWPCPVWAAPKRPHIPLTCTLRYGSVNPLLFRSCPRSDVFAFLPVTALLACPRCVWPCTVVQDPHPCPHRTLRPPGSTTPGFRLLPFIMGPINDAFQHSTWHSLVSQQILYRVPLHKITFLPSRSCPLCCIYAESSPFPQFPPIHAAAPRSLHLQFGIAFPRFPTPPPCVRIPHVPTCWDTSSLTSFPACFVVGNLSLPLGVII
jgi:hypothetical protein